MATTIHVGGTIVQTVVGSDGPLAPGALIAVSAIPSQVTAAVDATTNKVTLHGVAVGVTSVSYSAVGHQSASDTVNIIAPPPLPTLVITDGPET